MCLLHTNKRIVACSKKQIRLLTVGGCKLMADDGMSNLLADDGKTEEGGERRGEGGRRKEEG